MQQDNALKKALRTNAAPQLQPDFNRLLMEKIERSVEIEKKRSYWLGIALISFTSFALILVAIYLLYDKLSLHFYLRMPSFQITSELVGKYGFCFYIAFLVLILLGIDNYLRNLKQRKTH